MDKWAELFEEKVIFSWSFHRVDITAIKKEHLAIKMMF